MPSFPPPPPPPLPSGSGPAQIDDLWDLNGRGKLAERQQRQQIHLLPPHQTASPQTTIYAPHPFPLLRIATKTTSSGKPPKIEIPRTNQLPTKSTLQRNLTTLISHNTARSQLLPLTGNKRKSPKIPTDKELHGATKPPTSANTKKNQSGTNFSQMDGIRTDGTT